MSSDAPRALCVAVGALALAVSSLPARGQQGAPNEGRVQGGTRLVIERDLEYGRGGGQPLTLDLYRPDPVTTPLPVVIWIHGTKGGDSTKATTPAVALMPAYAVASIEYRSSAPMAARVADAKAAVRWLRTNAGRFNIDASKVGVFGHDDGATLAALLGTTGDVATLEGEGGISGPGSRVQAVVAVAGPNDRSQPVNPLAFVTKDDAATLLLHGTADTVVPSLQSQALVSALKVAGVETTLDLQIGAPHELNRLLSPVAMQQISAFFDQTLRGQSRSGSLTNYLATPYTEWIDPVALDLGGTLYKTYATPVRGPGTIASYRVYLPPDYQSSGARRYPVIYFLHGSIVDSKRPIVAGYVARIDAAIRSGVMPPVIVVLPQGLNQNRYIDSRDGSKPMESVIIKNLIPHIDGTYRTIATRQGRAIEGHSMGGFGALHIGFNNPELFIAVTGNSPGGATLDIPQPDPRSNRIDAFSIVYGGDRNYYVAMAPTTLAAKNQARVRQQAIRVICGTEDDLFPGAQFVHNELTKLGVKHEWLPVPASPHNHDQLLQYQTFDTMAFYGTVFGRTNVTSVARALSGPRGEADKPRPTKTGQETP
jgi:acetyl esterase/lipase/enterochelin esterase-like enzyme